MENRDQMWKVLLLVGLLSVGLIVITISILLGAQSDYYGMMGGMMGAGWIVMIIVLVAIVLFIVWVVDERYDHHATMTYHIPPIPESYLSSAKDASRILDERYARGEISRDEYLRIKADLK